ncbi:S8 family serine peptidase [Herbidospora cretacea]|uniref:S8 family serine peptidase n=1 Tax=Herbidospora cretacea TaxID=28444 RepID=UPI000AE433A5|nr:S8 family serine peptidase [Herbidospora cretacea]
MTSVASRLLLVCMAAGLILPAPARADEPGAVARERQWPLEVMGVPAAWKLSRGEGVTVAVLDTGVDARHPDLAGAVVEGPDLTGAGTTHAGHHGTAMAGLIAGRGHGPGGELGVVGVAPRARVLSIRVTLEADDPARTDPHVAARVRGAVARGIRWAVDHGAEVISMSLGGSDGSYRGSADEAAAVRYALTKGVVLVASSGNDGAGANRRNFPAAYPGVIAVGAVDARLDPAPFSNRQSYVSVSAPGTGIVSTDAHGSYVVGDGTSSAAAFVAGIAALVKARHPGIGVSDVRLAILQGATRRDDPDGTRAGVGVAHARRALLVAGAPRRVVMAARPRQAIFGGVSESTLSGPLIWAALLLLVAALVATVALRA